MDILVKLVVVGIVVPTSAAVFTYVFLFKVMAHMQQRLGPMEAGPHGSLQLVAEGLKFLQKEDLFPRHADKLVFALAPIVMLTMPFLLFVVIPAGPHIVAADLGTGVVYAMAVSGLGVLATLMAGWASMNKFSLLGALRSAAQLLAYEIPLVLATLGVVVQAGTLSLTQIVEAQHPVWYVVPQAFGFVLFLVAAQAELQQSPFDMPVADTEIVAGHFTEYTGFRFLLFFLAELATAAALSALGVTLFLGGWKIPFVSLHGLTAAVVGPIVVAVKVMVVGFLIFWVRFSFPRLREDQLQSLAWKALVPLAVANLAVTAVLKVLV